MLMTSESLAMLHLAGYISHHVMVTPPEDVSRKDLPQVFQL